MSGGGFNGAYLGNIGTNVGPPNRSVNGAEGQNWQSQSDPYPKQQSQGHRPRTCGLVDVGRGLWRTIVNGNLVEEAFDFAMHGPELALMLMPMEAWHLAFQLTTALNPYDYVMDIGSLLTGTDWLTGEELTDFDKAALLFGVFTGIGDEVAKIGKKAMQVEKLRDVAKRGQGLWGSVKNLAATGRSLLDDIGQRGIREVARETAGKLRKKVSHFFGGGPKKTIQKSKPPSRKAVDTVQSSSKKRTLLDRIGGRQTLKDRVDKVVNARQARTRIDGRLNTVARGDFGDTARAVRKKYDAAIQAQTKRTPAQAKRWMSQTEGGKEIYQDSANYRKRLDRVFESVDNIALGTLGGITIETGRQYYENVNSGMNPLEAALNLDPLSRDMGLAILVGAGIGASVGARRMVTGESLGTAIGQVGAGAGFNALATGLGSTNPGDLYIAAAIGGLAVPTTGFYEKRNPTREALVNAGVGSLASSLQHGLTQYYNGNEITGQELLYNFSGGIGPGLAKATVNRVGVIPKKPLPFDDFTVAASASLTGGYAIPTSLSLLFGN